MPIVPSTRMGKAFTGAMGANLSRASVGISQVLNANGPLPGTYNLNPTEQTALQSALAVVNLRLNEMTTTTFTSDD